MTVNECLTILSKYNYGLDEDQDFNYWSTNGIIDTIIVDRKTKPNNNQELEEDSIVLSVKPSTENILDSFNKINDEECIADFNKFIVTTIALPSLFYSEANFLDDSKGFIYLVDKPNTYHTHSIDLLEHCLKINNNDVLNHYKFLNNCHNKTIDFAISLQPILFKYHYVLDSLFEFDDNAERNACRIIEYTISGYHDKCQISTDPITGDTMIIYNDSELLNVTQNEFNISDFENSLKETFEEWYEVDKKYNLKKMNVS